MSIGLYAAWRADFKFHIYFPAVLCNVSAGILFLILLSHCNIFFLLRCHRYSGNLFYGHITVLPYNFVTLLQGCANDRRAALQYSYPIGKSFGSIFYFIREGPANDGFVT